jgi:hypothetical protein
MTVSTPAAPATTGDWAGLNLPELASPPLAPDLPLPAAPPSAATSALTRVSDAPGRHEEPARLLHSAPEMLAPASPAGDHYLVIARHRAGNYAPEREETDLVSREQTIRDIYEGQIEEVASVFAFNPGRGTCRDATAEIARDVAGLHFTEQTQPHWRRRDWLHKVLGPHQADLILGVRR